MKAGAAVPMRLSLGGDLGLDVLQSGFPASVPVSCSPAGATDAVEELVSASASSFTYSAATGQYTYIWKTSSSWAGTCRKFLLGLKDGGVREAPLPVHAVGRGAGLSTLRDCRPSGSPFFFVCSRRTIPGLALALSVSGIRKRHPLACTRCSVSGR